jgi:hypothetical protein
MLIENKKVKKNSNLASTYSNLIDEAKFDLYKKLGE